MKTLTNTDNAVVKKIRSLKHKKYRDKERLFFIEGLRFVRDAINNFNSCIKVNIQSVIISESFYNANQDFINTNFGSSNPCEFHVIKVSDKIFSYISDTETAQGIGAVIEFFHYNENETIEKSNNFLIMDRIQDPGNMGTLIRTADAAAFDAAILSKGCVDMYNPKVLRSTMGSIFHIPIIQSRDILKTIQAMKDGDVKIYAADLKGTQSSFSEEFAEKTAIITGNEANGICDEILNTADVLLKIPMPGMAESLNASVAGSLLMYEVLRKK